MKMSQLSLPTASRTDRCRRKNDRRRDDTRQIHRSRWRGLRTVQLYQIPILQASRISGGRGGDVPGEQLLDAVDAVVGDGCQDRA